MSRIGRSPIAIPSGVAVSVLERTVSVTGPKGSLARVLPGEITLREETGTLFVERPNEERQSKALHGLTRTLVSNMIVGVSTGFSKELEIVGVGYRAAAPSPDRLEMALGYSHPVHVQAPAGITFEVPTPTRIIVRGSDKEVIGQVAANIRKLRKPEPYKGKGVKYAGERILRKAGKAAKK